MYNKKGIEMSMNFFVTILISLVILGFGIKFVYDLADQATQLRNIATDDLDDRISDLLCGSSDRICIGIERKTIEKGDFDIFGIKIINVQSSANFQVNVETVGYTLKSSEIVNDPNILDKIHVKWNDETFRLERNDEKSVGIGVEIDNSALGGTYILDVQVLRENQDYGGLHKYYVDVI